MDGRSRSSAHKQHQLGSPWLKPEDAGAEELTEYGEHECLWTQLRSILIHNWEKETYVRWLFFTTQIVFHTIHQRHLLKDGILLRIRYLPNHHQQAQPVNKNVIHTMKLGANSLG